MAAFMRLSSPMDEKRSTWPLYAIGSLILAPIAFERIYDKLWPLAERANVEAAEDEDRAGPTEEEKERRRIIRLERHLVDRPGVALPTLLLSAVALVGWGASMHLYCARILDARTAFGISTVCAFISFTPMHDASHHSVSSRYRWLNELIGHLSGIPLLFPFVLFRHMHMLHHKHANDRGDGPAGISKDPDRFAGEGPLALLPFRWAAVLLWYTYWGKKDYKYRMNEAVQKNDTAEIGRLLEMRNSSFAFWVVAVTALTALWWHGRDLAPIVCWVAPGLTATSFLMYVFDYVPHRPHKVPHTENPYMATSATRGIFGTVGELDVPMLAQNLHNIHHLFPRVPFYRYRAVWNAHRSELITRGTRELPLFLWDRSAHCAELRDGTHASQADNARPLLLGKHLNALVSCEQQHLKRA
eukprot:TRINITY_DN45758_c0_g1_i1.p1 TRINITY_DN45758_c0_g1~~TRINITY_DN45758_c0_g1_i1.p1  ORF type:complete len:414 (-),score=43.16 TRINITY_DN45758_c0_g1_i1:230-1471(-)